MRGIIYFSAALILFLALIVEIYKRYLEHPIIEDIDKLESKFMIFFSYIYTKTVSFLIFL